MKTDNFNHAEKVLVLGAGQLGAAVLDALVPAVIERQGTVSVIVSPAAWDEAGQLRSANHQALADAGATFLAVDIAGSAMETLADQFRGFTTVINCMGFVAGPGTQLKITRAVLAAGVPRYFPWQFGVNYDVVGKGSGQPVWDEQYDVRTLLRAQRATEWVIVSTGDVYQLSLRTRLRCSECIQPNPSRPWQLGYPGDRHLTGGHWPPDHGDLSASAADRQRGGVCCRRNDLLPTVGGYRGARNAADVQQSRPHPARPAGAAADKPG